MNISKNTLQVPFTRVLVTLELSSGRPVSHFPETTLKGGIGYTLKELVCLTGAKTCDNCMLNASCAYAFLFETPPPPDAPRMKKYRTVPHPFTMKAIQKESILTFELTLFGGAYAYLSYFIYALNKLGEKGLGKEKVRFIVKNVLWGERVIYQAKNCEIDQNITADTMIVEPGEPQNGTVELKFSSPLALRKEGRVISSFDTNTFFTTLLRRCTNLNAFFGVEKQKEIDPDAYLHAVSSLETQSSMGYHRRSRYSTRQKKKLDYSGIVGKVVLSGDIGTLMPLLYAGEVFGVGKNTTYGGGVYRVKEVCGTEKGNTVETGLLQ
ncbi:CRISPR system precrRNA processing endoribonuclease RAMP protein Cas6 [Chitinispirillales bacterium ANBcel5]|uniref:CRISPR system precrRNA processing endoribonuclease RAMP protein Cas6 n=1 Tax=Cellulosispirillum alkaliphilum TaxID=3039283 RepID=UPI002A57006F|nr:CRISPR system precrRNA processing endoribonuclease RAMP protein Cas6 [Chitinispirillales bacterium ANBcel5]